MEFVRVVVSSPMEGRAGSYCGDWICGNGGLTPMWEEPTEMGEKPTPEGTVRSKAAGKKVDDGSGSLLVFSA